MYVEISQNANPLYTGNPKLEIWQTVKTQMKCSIMLVLHCLIKVKTTIHNNLENFTCDLYKYTVGSPILIVSICMGKYARIQTFCILKTPKWVFWQTVMQHNASFHQVLHCLLRLKPPYTII